MDDGIIIFFLNWVLTILIFVIWIVYFNDAPQRARGGTKVRSKHITKVVKI